ncbi:LOW QUALITY PROTEIN: uncharacterized protein LOC134173178, partial [Pezoporus occidentalis]|uniref:LOW QUALITY PROTEIN: uncharacterized protein LOC134173178 n=1 Tax=Pezoporus occidentalis TaxID=407982 RepID=UPI002F9130A2
STTSLGNLFQCFDTITVKNFFLTPNLNFPSSSLKPCPPVPSLHVLVKKFLIHINNRVVFCCAWLSPGFTSFKNTLLSPLRIKTPRISTFQAPERLLLAEFVPFKPNKASICDSHSHHTSICIITTLAPPGSNYAAHGRSSALGQLQRAGGVRGRHLCLMTGVEPVPGVPAELPREAAPPSFPRADGEGAGRLFVPAACVCAALGLPEWEGMRGSHPRPRRH